jgi:hypothetical protein
MRKQLLIALVIILPIISIAQDNNFGIKFHGFVKNDIYWDSRQYVAAREGQFYLYPKGESFDNNGNDINATPTFNIISIQTRLKGVITGPDAFGAKTSAVIEGAFFGHTAADINGFRLRHAFAKLNWTNTELLVGQYWHSMFITECFPGTVSFNTGAPFQPFSRNPQIRLTQKFGDFKIKISAMSQRDFVSSGPEGASTKYLRNSVLPEMNLTIQYNKKSDNNEFLIGAGVDYKKLTPRLITDSLYSTNETSNSLSTMAFLKIKIPALTIKMEGIYGQDMYSMTMIGGYAVTDIIDISKNYLEYTPLTTLSFWTDIHTNGKEIQAGLFAGYSQNMGCNKTIIGNTYARGGNINYLYRVSPRIMFNSGKMRFSGEVEYTTAAYGLTDIDGTVFDSKEVSNLRLLIGVYYFF